MCAARLTRLNPAAPRSAVRDRLCWARGTTAAGDKLPGGGDRAGGGGSGLEHEEARPANPRDVGHGVQVGEMGEEKRVGDPDALPGLLQPVAASVRLLR